MDGATNDIAVSVKNVAKDFLLPHEKNNSIKSSIVNVFKRKDRRIEVQHALKDISFDIKKGEFFGIVGRNGSGKSTLLKILSEIYQPTKGSVRTYGKVVPFIELGVGFNPELTGRENVYLNGAMLGFSKKQIDVMYNDIVEFAELEEFMDQKLKNYSSGMQVRLAFSVATQAKAEVLIIDEVLAVGDAAFQRKCYEYFKSLRETNITTIFVTHDMSAVEDFCTRAIMIRDGNIVASGTPKDVANEYTRANFVAKNEQKDETGYELGLNDRVPYFKVKPSGKKTIMPGEDMVFDIEYEIKDDTPVNVKISIRDTIRGVDILQNGAKALHKAGRNRLSYTFPTAELNNMELIVSAVLDEEGTNKRIAHTNDNNSGRVIIDAGDTANLGIINRGHELHGYWNGWHDI